MRRSEHEVVAEVRQVTLRRLRLWVRRGWIAPAAGEAGPVFDDLDVARVRLVCHLRQELNLNEDAVPVVLSLMDQLYGIRHRFRTLTEVVEAQPEEVRKAVREAYRAVLKD
ncbi:MAG: MerR family transcriptional regulator [Hyphomicrobiaceae bacterium]|nr:MerR family transcriptional regulator [Hyphomicrobiaceae bacterium]